MRRWVLILGMLVGSAHGASCQQAPQPSGLAGCYALDLTEWQPSLPDPDKAYHTPPDTVRLSDQVGDGSESPIERGRRLARPVISRGRTPSAYWIHERSGAVQVVWTNGHAGVQLELHDAGNGFLAGNAEAFTDLLGRRNPTAGVTLRRSECAGP